MKYIKSEEVFDLVSVLDELEKEKRKNKFIRVIVIIFMFIITILTFSFFIYLDIEKAEIILRINNNMRDAVVQIMNEDNRVIEKVTTTFDSLINVKVAEYHAEYNTAIVERDKNILLYRFNEYTVAANDRMKRLESALSINQPDFSTDFSFMNGSFEREVDKKIEIIMERISSLKVNIEIKEKEFLEREVKKIVSEDINRIAAYIQNFKQTHLDNLKVSISEIEKSIDNNMTELRKRIHFIENKISEINGTINVNNASSSVVNDNLS